MVRLGRKRLRKVPRPAADSTQGSAARTWIRTRSRPMPSDGSKDSMALSESSPQIRSVTNAEPLVSARRQLLDALLLNVVAHPILDSREEAIDLVGRPFHDQLHLAVGQVLHVAG